MVTEPSVQTSAGSARGGGVSLSALAAFGRGRSLAGGAHLGFDGDVSGTGFAASAGGPKASPAARIAANDKRVDRETRIGMVLPGGNRLRQYGRERPDGGRQCRREQARSCCAD
jgi:hypothetical protein